jgi:hypothetical protein
VHCVSAVVTTFMMIAHAVSILMVADSATVPLLTCTGVFMAVRCGGTVATFGSLHHTVSMTLCSGSSSSSSSNRSSSNRSSSSNGYAGRLVTVDGGNMPVEVIVDSKQF